MVAFKALPRSQFRLLQTSTWPVYFRMQIVVILLLSLTLSCSPLDGSYAFSRNLYESKTLRFRAGLLLCLGTVASLNYWALGPLTRRVVKQIKIFGTCSLSFMHGLDIPA